MSSGGLAGEKRKRYTATEKDVSVKLTGKLYHGFKEVRKAVKRAKKFETQKLIKRLKNLGKPAQNTDEVTREVNDVQAQLEYLKDIDQERVARLALSSKLRKDRTLSSYEALFSSLASMAPGLMVSDENVMRAKVESRLLSSKLLAGEVASVLWNLKAVLEPKLKSEVLGDLMQPKKVNQPSEDGHSQGGTVVIHEDGIMDGGMHPDEKEVEDLDDVVNEVDGSEWGLDSVHAGDDESSDNDVSPESLAPPCKRSKKASSAKLVSHRDTLNTGSTVLPSFSVGFIQGDSDSDFNQSEGEATGSVRKNRRGQRARQAIWEKKYGGDAKHIKRRREETKAMHTAKKMGKTLDRGWDGIRGSQISNDPRSRTKPEKPPHRGTVRSAGGEGPIHPSWEAKRRLKEKEGPKILNPQGKKTIFA